jgi:protein-disulfide isomerase
VQRDIEEGTRLGVTRTPTFFVDGRLVSGAQPLERFVHIIEAERRLLQPVWFPREPR